MCGGAIRILLGAGKYVHTHTKLHFIHTRRININDHDDISNWLTLCSVSILFVYFVVNNNRDFKWVAFNGRPDGVHRQLFISHLGDDLEAVFHNCPRQAVQWK